MTSMELCTRPRPGIVGGVGSIIASARTRPLRLINDFAQTHRTGVILSKNLPVRELAAMKR